MTATTDPSTSAALIQEWTWKTPAMRAMTLAVCRLAIQRGAHDTFSALDLPDRGADRQGGTGIAGSVFRLLSESGIIAPVGVFVDGGFLQKRVRNAGGNQIGLWRLAHPGRAQALIAKHDPRPARAEQMALAL